MNVDVDMDVYGEFELNGSQSFWCRQTQWIRDFLLALGWAFRILLIKINLEKKALLEFRLLFASILWIGRAHDCINAETLINSTRALSRALRGLLFITLNILVGKQMK